MSFYRSETVKHCKLILPRDNAQQIMHVLGQQNIIHIVQTNTSILSRPYMHQVKRCNQCLMRLRQIELVLNQQRILIKRQEFTNKQYTAIFEHWKKQYEGVHIHSVNVLDQIDQNIEVMWKTYKQSISRIQQINTKLEHLKQNLAIIKAGSKQFGNSFFSEVKNIQQLNIQYYQDSMKSSQVSIKAGVIKLSDELNFKRTIFRITKSNCFVIFVPYEDIFQSLKNEQKNKIVFFVLYSGLRGGVLDKKLQRFISSFCPKSYILPQSMNQYTKTQKNLEEKIQQNQNILKLNRQQFNKYLTTISQFLPQQSFSKIQTYKLYIIKQKQVYNQLNQMQVYNNFLQVSIYIRVNDIIRLHRLLKQIQQKSNYPAGQFIEIKEDNPPTCFIRNSFTYSAQQIVQTYGVARYKQANPSFFTVVTFPFLFGVMFGDIAHGSILMLFGLMLVFKRNQLKSQLVRLLIPHRYIIVLMGFFSMYCGFIYNDFMSITLNLFGSCYNVSQAIPGYPIQRISAQCVYPFGLDPVWSVSANELNYVDSLKMKISVIIGVIHMTLGIFVKGSNSLYFKRWLDFFFQFIPQVILMTVLFGYMDFLIIYKWLKNWSPYEPNAPSIITTMINMPLKLGETQNCCGGQPLWGVAGQTSQNSIQLFLLVMAILCIPLMLLPKPLILMYKKKQVKKDSDIIEVMQQNQILNQQNEDAESKESNSQIFVHQLIETIEYVLGSISNTASYLRLWALSLAHSQLSQVFYQKTVELGIIKNYSGIPLMIFTYPILACMTIGVLLCMDSMQCFLHTLRLHWVEFQNKFYKGDGYLFSPVNFQNKINQQLKQN